MLRKLKLYGQLAEFIGHKEFEIKVNSVSQAVSFLIHNFPEVERFMSPKYYQVKVGNYDIDESELAYPVGQEDIHFIPAISGAGRGFGKILLGGLLIGAAFMNPALGLSSFAKTQVGSAVAFSKLGIMTKSAFYIGTYLVLGGISQMLTPTPETPEEDPENSFAFNSPVNTARAGLAIPLIYGERLVGSAVISAGIRTERVVEE